MLNLDSVDRARALHAQTLAISKEAKAFLDDWLDTWVAFQKAPPQSLGAGPKKDALEVMNKLAKAFGGEKGLRNMAELYPFRWRCSKRLPATPICNLARNMMPAKTSCTSK